MKKILFSAALVAATLISVPASAQEPTYVEDCSQGLLLNRNKDNWFITARGGANFSFGQYDMKAKDLNRIGGTGAIYAGKWLTPTFGLRFGFNMTQSRGATTVGGEFRDYAHSQLENGFYPKKYYGVGVEIDGLINMTNWIMGYRPGRVYNLVLHGGFGNMWFFRHEQDNGDVKWKFNEKNRVFYANLGLENNFRVSDAVNLFVDVEGQCVDFPRADWLVNLTAGITYRFKKREWNCPVTAQCPTWKYTDAEGDALVARLGQADAKIADLQNQLDACLNAPKQKATTVVKGDCDVLATVYYPINVSSLGKRETGILSSVAQVMKQNPDTHYVLTGWADNFTGNDEINTRLRNARVDGVRNFLIKCGVNPDQIESGIDAGSLTDFGREGASLDRAVTIRQK